MRASGRDRAISAGSVVLLHVGALWLLLHAREPTQLATSTTSLATFEITPPPPAPPPPPRASHTDRRTGRGGLSGVKAVRSAVAAPIPLIVPPLPLSAPVSPQDGTAIVGGAAATGVGAGDGQRGDGVGSGNAGDGAGAGSGTRAQLVAGTIGPRDYPKAERSARVGGVVTVAFTVRTDGHVDGCAVTRSSGNPALDRITCQLIEARFRYTPARDAAGSPVSERRGWQQRWWVERE
ncbi:energy transducer TonB [Sphingomonas sp. HHU CXW]|uniref:Protein TonB n=1 Tax=Sphingomonas hominis TaxID=2741495 RepID=A0ABX2JMN5_9SPHN|nr:energy transducer TonB [Sphingomonas hominis]NTS65095.1 energy transducer TonB [Sphingomonas hominis]